MSVSEYVFCMPSANVMESVDVVLSSSSVAVSLCAFLMMVISSFFMSYFYLG